MTTITTITEKRIQKMQKDNHKFAECLAYILREIKCSCGCDGCTVAQLKKLELELPNATQINVYEMPDIYGI